MIKVFAPIRDKFGNLIRGLHILSFRKPAPTDLTWEEKTQSDYMYVPRGEHNGKSISPM